MARGKGQLAALLFWELNNLLFIGVGSVMLTVSALFYEGGEAPAPNFNRAQPVPCGAGITVPRERETVPFGIKLADVF